MEVGAELLVRLAGVKDRYEHHWPDGSVEEFKVVSYDVVFEDHGHEVMIGFTEREAFGRTRRRVVVFIDGHPIVEFAGADDYEQLGHLIAIIKKPDGKYMRMNEVNLYIEYAGMTVAEHSRFIDKSLGGKEGVAALVVTEDDHKAMIRHALTQLKWRKEKHKSER